MDDGVKKKNLLDLQFQKYLTLASTSIIIMFTYLVGVGIAILTKQVDLNDFIVMGILFVVSGGILGICSALFFKAIFHLKNIPEVIKDI
ncbi:hypothetical protein J4463_00630 [Candidatus Pacearchaeota archaeon]|nr:hypothetical protein [Candidatus Pacearchaeota archaeon]